MNFLGLAVERVAQQHDAIDQVVLDRLDGRDMHRRRVGVVGRLAHVDVVVGVDGFFEPIVPPAISMARFEITSLTFMLDCVPEPVCQTTSGKWSLSLPAMTSSAAFTIRSRVAFVHQAELEIGQRRRLLEDAEGPDDLDRHLLAADVEIGERAGRLGAVILVGRHIDGAHGVGFDADRSHSNSPKRKRPALLGPAVKNCKQSARRITPSSVP
jgi:hypothetical protein